MAHLIVLRSAPSFVQVGDVILPDGQRLPVETFYGQHEIMEFNINQRKYDFVKFRKGYNIPHSSQWNIMEYRCKKEIIPEFVRDLNARVLNPCPNDATLTKILFPYNKKSAQSVHLQDGKNNVEVTTGRLILLAQYAFKWLYRISYVIAMTAHTIYFIYRSIRHILKTTLKIGKTILTALWLFIRRSGRLSKLQALSQKARELCQRKRKMRTFMRTLHDLYTKKLADYARIWFKHASNKYHLPLKPVPKADGEPNRFSTKWGYHFVFGSFEDIDRGYGEEL